MGADYFFLIIRWLHAISAVAWVGGGIFYWVVLRPAAPADELPPGLRRIVAMEFGQLVAFCIGVLALTGIILAAQRLSEEVSSVTYVAVLAAKVALSVWMFAIVAFRRGRSDASPRRGRLGLAVNALGHVNVTVVLGLVIFLLSDVLQLLVERGLVD